LLSYRIQKNRLDGDFFWFDTFFDLILGLFSFALDLESF